MEARAERPLDQAGERASCLSDAHLAADMVKIAVRS